MSARSFRSVFMVASCAGAALGCYLVSLRVASERAALESVETEIVLAQRDIRLLQTEIGTRGRLAQLERWNVKVLALSAPSADQFLDGGFALAKLVAPPKGKVDLDAPVVLAAAPANGPRPQLETGTDQPSEGVSASQMMHVASLKRETRPTTDPAPKAAPPKSTAPKSTAPKSTAPKSTATQLVSIKPARGSKPPAATKAMPALDPLAPIASNAKPKTVASSTTAPKENGSKQ